MLEKDYEYYLKNKENLIQKFSGSYVVIQNQKILNVLSNLEEAYFFLKNSHKKGSFLVQKVDQSDLAKSALFSL